MLIALLVPMALAILAFAWILLRAVDRAQCLAKPGGDRPRRDHQFLRHPGHRLFRSDHRLVQVPQARSRPADPADDAGGPAVPTMAQSVIFLALLGVMVDPVLLVGCAISVLLGGLLGAPLVAKARVWIVQLVVAIALLVAAVFYALTNLNLMPGGGTATSLPILLTIIAIVANFAFGVLLNFGVGNYAPTLVMFSLMGMDPRLVFPIMASGAALTVAGAGARHIAIGQIDFRIAIGMTMGASRRSSSPRSSSGTCRSRSSAGWSWWWCSMPLR